MGVRIHFPLADFNSWAKIQPPFEIPAFEKYDDRRSRQHYARSPPVPRPEQFDPF